MVHPLLFYGGNATITKMVWPLDRVLAANTESSGSSRPYSSCERQAYHVANDHTANEGTVGSDRPSQINLAQTLTNGTRQPVLQRRLFSGFDQDPQVLEP